MRTRLIAILPVALSGLLSLFASTSVLAHNPGHGYAYAGIPLTGGITIRSSSHGYTGYAGNVSLGFSSGYAHHGYTSVPYDGYVQGLAYDYRPSYRDYRGYGRGYRNGNYSRHYYGIHHGRRY